MLFSLLNTHICTCSCTGTHTHRGYNQLLQIWVIEFSLEKSDWGNSSSLVFGKIWWYAEPERKEQHGHRDKCSFLGHKQTTHLPRYVSRGYVKTFLGLRKVEVHLFSFTNEFLWCKSKMFISNSSCGTQKSKCFAFLKKYIFALLFLSFTQNRNFEITPIYFS